MLKNISFILFLVCQIPAAFTQDAGKINQEYEMKSSLRQNRNMVFAGSIISSNKPANATQAFRGDDFVYARVFFAKPISEVLFLEKNDDGLIPIDVFVEDLTNRSSMYISFDLTEDEMAKTYFDFDILPDPDHWVRNGKQFETGRFSYFLKEAGLENKKPVFKFTIGDATGYIQVDFSATNLEQVKERDRLAYQNSHKTREGQEKQ